MAYVQGKCPECGGMFAVDTNEKASICLFCGKAFIVQEAIELFGAGAVEVKQSAEENTSANAEETTETEEISEVAEAPEDGNSEEEEAEAEDASESDAEEELTEDSDFIIEDGILKEYLGTNSEVVIPDGVVEIGKECFKKKPITSVILPEGLKIIGDSAFSGCSNLEEVIISDSVKNIGESAFLDCGKLTKIAIPDSVTVIGSFSFSGCKSITDINIPKKAKKIHECTFKDCTSLRTVVVPKNVKKIAGHAFDGCENLETVVLSDGVTEIDSFGFYNCTGLVSITIPEGVEKINMYTFCGCTNLTSVSIPKSVTLIREGAFEGCDSLRSISVPNKAAEVSNYALPENCELLMDTFTAPTPPSSGTASIPSVSTPTPTASAPEPVSSTPELVSSTPEPVSSAVAAKPNSDINNFIEKGDKKMTRQDYINQVAHLPREEQAQALEAMFKDAYAANSSSVEALVLCEALAFDYEVFQYKIGLPDLYYDTGNYERCAEYCQGLCNEMKGHGCSDFYFLMGLSYEELNRPLDAIQSYNMAPRSLFSLLSLGGTQEIDFASLPESTLHQISSYYCRAGVLYFKLNRYSDAVDAFCESFKYYYTSDAAIYMGIICYEGYDGYKNIRQAEELFEMVANTEATEPKLREYVATANYKLGVIYATENGFVNRAKAEAHLQKAMSLGYAVSDAEIATLLNNIPAPKKKSFLGSIFG